jgi:hypothetical protein
MSSSSQSPIHYGYASASDLTWSRSEKAVARAAFDAALKRELHEVMQEAKQMANRINEPADLWNLEQYLSQRRKEIDRKYDYRYSQLTHVFGRLLHESRLGEEELRGLGEDKLKSIRSFAKFDRERSLTRILSAIA